MSRFLRRFGQLLTIAALVFFLLQAWRERESLRQLVLAGDGTLFAFVASALLFAAIYPLTGSISSRFLHDMGITVRSAELIAVLCISQLARYIPGNVGQHIARGAMLSARGVPGSVVIVSLGYEALLAFLAAALLAASALLLLFSSGDAEVLWITVSMIIAALAALAVLPVVWRIVPESWRVQKILKAMREISFATQASCLAVYLANYWLVGLGLAILGWQLPDGEQVALSRYVGAFAVAWTAGFLVPGLPAGLGMRESVLVALLQPSMGIAPAVLLATLHRLSTTVGDALAAAVGFAMIRYQTTEHPVPPTPSRDDADET